MRDESLVPLYMESMSEAFGAARHVEQGEVGAAVYNYASVLDEVAKCCLACADSL